MPGGNKNINGKDNTKGFQVNPQNINRSGRKKSFEAEFLDQYGHEGKASLIKRLYEIAELGKDAEATNAIKYLLDQIFGKATQAVEHSGEIKSVQTPTIVFMTGSDDESVIRLAESIEEEE